nr:hypothetical protein [Tanacetum cinerariifolium]
EDIFCHQCTCESCGKCAHYGYNCPSKVPIIPNPEPCNNQTIDELFGDENSFTYDSKSKILDDSPNVFNPPPQPLTYSCITSDSEIVSLEVVEIVIPEVVGIDADIFLTIKDDILREKLLNVNLLIAKIKALKDNPTLSSDFVAKSSSTSLNFLLEETNSFDNSLPESETFCFNLEEISSEISSDSATTPPDISLPEYEVFHDDHVKEISSGSPTTHSDSPLYASFMFDLSINPFPPADR